jgi:DNA polymerase-3 subunit epsilon
VPLDFTAIDFETANASRASACSVGLVRVRSGQVVATSSWLIKPPAGHDEFHAWNTRIHGIRREDVGHAATWEEQFSWLTQFVGNDVLVAHNAGFDLGVLRYSAEVTGLKCPPYQSLCSLQVARKVYELDSYRLPVAAAAAGYAEFSHHDALADAQACAQIIVDAASRNEATDVQHLAKLLGLQLAVAPANEAKELAIA